jgi:sodium/potassium-transporting ATPase subunit alpha
MNGLNEKSLVYDSIPEEDVKEANKALQAAEELQPIQNRKTEGDASEAGLVKFVEPILGLEKERARYPTFSYNVGDNKQIEALIPFSSEIKFNMFVRDMNKEVKNPKTSRDGLWIFMKGAPERILNRCSKILINGEVRPFDDFARKEVT